MTALCCIVNAPPRVFSSVDDWFQFFVAGVVLLGDRIVVAPSATGPRSVLGEQSMCGGPDSRKSSSSPAATPSSPSPAISSSSPSTMNTENNSPSLLELAANNDVKSFKLLIERIPKSADEIGPWYGRKNGSASNQMILDSRTPLMVAATYGNVEILDLILSLDSVDVNRHCGSDNTTALHCAAAGGSLTAVDAVKALLLAGADPNAVDASNRRPSEVILVHPRHSPLKSSLEDLLGSTPPSHDFSNSPSSPDDSNSDSPLEIPPPEKEKKEYPIDPSLPDIKNSIYATDEFRMFSFKVRPCSRAYSHDWTECPFVHPGENARRRDPRKYHYSCVPCPDFRKGTCRRGDLCEYAHGVFECWLHPAQYRTRLCKDGTNCSRRVCFFAHTAEELRPLYVSTGSAVPSPRTSSSATMDMSLLPGSPSFTPPMSPSAVNAIAWQQPSVPALHLPLSNLQTSRLRSSLSARDVQAEDYLEEFAGFSSPGRMSSIRRPKGLNPSNLEDLFSMEMSSSPRYGSEQMHVFSPTHKAAVLNQFQQQQSLMLERERSFGVISPRFGGLSPGMRENWGRWGGAQVEKSDWGTGEEPDLSWVQSLVKEPSPEMMKNRTMISGDDDDDGQRGNGDGKMDHAVLGTWMEQLQMD